MLTTLIRFLFCLAPFICTNKTIEFSQFSVTILLKRKSQHGQSYQPLEFRYQRTY
ncbi:hypothetical protein HanHA300_Chr06g0224481 [Helianthus annuus]|nr:hypothetical protein HanHA300_Chr06g0224481 [Helianthus annuus]KAJ0574635.1 hypothetical protein HanHA89_Chr06g0240441 [Helianthus annuus]KAJ0738964.1 hypothetical protein HanLR1_Chr06g0224331 [Helianthus annuus]